MENETRQPDALVLAEIEATCLCLSVRKMARALTHRYETFLHPFDLEAILALVSGALTRKEDLAQTN